MKKKTIKFVSMLMAMLTLLSSMVCVSGLNAYAAVVSYSDRVPLKAYTISQNNVKTYKSIGGEKSGSIFGSSDLCTIKAFYDGWVLVNYPTSKGTKDAYCPVGEFIADPGFGQWSTTAGSNITAYRRSSGNETIGEVFSGDQVTVVSESDGRYQVIYPISGGYKLGWVSTSSISDPAAEAAAAAQAAAEAAAQAAAEAAAQAAAQAAAEAAAAAAAEAAAPSNIIGGVSYAGKTPLKTYARLNGKVTTYSSVDGPSTGYICGGDLCTVTEIYTNGWVKVSYPLDKGGSKTAYARLSDFVANPNHGVTELTSPSGITAYRRSSGSETIGTVYENDRIIVVSQENEKYQVIYPISGGYKMGWISISDLSAAEAAANAAAEAAAQAAAEAAAQAAAEAAAHAAAEAAAQTAAQAATANNIIGGVSYAGKTPLKTYARLNGKVTTYSSVDGSSTGYICGGDLCTVTEIYTNGWVKVSYPLDKGGSKTAYARLSDFVANPNYETTELTSPVDFTAYRRSSGSETMGTVFKGDRLVVVSKENERTQVIYPISGGYKLGWLSNSDLTAVVVDTVYGFIDDVIPITTTTTATAAALPPENTNSSARVSKNTTVFGGPGSNYAVIGEVFSTDAIKVLRRCGGYYEIEYMGQSKLKRGYVLASALVNAPDHTLLASGEPLGGVFYINKAEKTWGGPSSNNYESIGSVSYNEAVTCMWYESDDDDIYACIEYNTAKGKKRAYISSRYLSGESLANDTTVSIVDESSNAQVRSAMISILYGNSGGRMSCDFDGYTNTSGRHEGIDFKYSDGCKVYSLINGTVLYTNTGRKGSTAGDGKVSTISIYDTENDKTVIYLHVGDIQVSKGQSVTVGQHIANESNYGTSGFHTHIEVRDGKRERAAYSVDHFILDNSDPYPYWRKVMASYSAASAPAQSSSDPSCAYAISGSGLEFIKKWEGFRGYVYDDGAGYDTIGYGHKIKAGEHFTTLTESEALELLRKDVSGAYTRNLNSFLKSNNITVSQAQYDALLSFTFNCGENVWNGKFVLRSLLLEYKNGDDIPDDMVRDAFGRWKYAGGKVMTGLVNRRAEEAAMFINS